MLMMLPKIGFMTWKDAVPHINWGTVALFGVGISLGAALLKSGAAIWLANHFVSLFGMETMSPLMVIAVLAFFLTVIHLGFASATGLAAAMIPIVIAVLQKVETSGINVLGMTMILQYTICFGYNLAGQCAAEYDRLQYGLYYIDRFFKDRDSVHHRCVCDDPRLLGHVLAMAGLCRVSRNRSRRETFLAAGFFMRNAKWWCGS